MSAPAEHPPIVVAVDGSPESDAAVAWSAREAALRHAPVKLTHVVVPVVTSYPPYGPVNAELAEWQISETNKFVQKGI